MNESPRGQLLTGTKAARRLGISYTALLRIIERQSIAVVRTDAGRLTGIYERDCDDWIEAHRTPRTTAGHEPSRLARRDVDRAVDELVAADERVF